MFDPMEKFRRAATSLISSCDAGDVQARAVLTERAKAKPSQVVAHGIG